MAETRYPARRLGKTNWILRGLGGFSEGIAINAGNSVRGANLASATALRVVTTCAVLSFLTLLAACGAGDRDLGNVRHVSWIERVEIFPGESVEISRRVRFLVSRALGEKTTGIDRIGASELQITGIGADEASIDTIHLLPILLQRDADTRDLLLIASTNNCDVWAMNGKPHPAYWVFRLHTGEWYRTDMPASFHGTKINLLIDIRPDDARLLDMHEVAKRKVAQLDHRGLPSQCPSISPSAAIVNCRNVDAGDGSGDFSNMERM